MLRPRRGGTYALASLLAAFAAVVLAALLASSGTPGLPSLSLPALSPSPAFPLAVEQPRDTGARSLNSLPITLDPAACGEREGPAGTPVWSPPRETAAGPPPGFSPAAAQTAEAPAAAGEELTILVDVQQLQLTLLVNGEPERQYPVAIGKWTTPTPVGEFVIVEKAYAPGGPFGAAWLGLNVPWGSYGIHGTNQPGSIGRTASAGCIRMHNHHVLELFDRVPLKTPVLIRGLEPFAHVGRRLGPGMTGHDVQYVQYRLREAGFDPGLLDGRYGQGTRLAVERFQRYYDLELTGSVGEDELYVLGIR